MLYSDLLISPPYELPGTALRIQSNHSPAHHSLPCPARWQHRLQWSQGGRPGDTICFNIQRRDGDSRAAGRIPARCRELLHRQYSDSISFRLQYQSVLWDYFPPKCSWFEYLHCTVRPPQLSAGFFSLRLCGVWIFPLTAQSTDHGWRIDFLNT